jgi:hypothetical protein
MGRYREQEPINGLMGKNIKALGNKESSLDEELSLGLKGWSILVIIQIAKKKDVVNLIGLLVNNIKEASQRGRCTEKGSSPSLTEQPNEVNG